MIDLESINGGELAKRFENLEQKVKTFLASDEFDTKLEELKEKYFLYDDLDEGAALERLTMLLVLNFLKPEEFAPEINRFLYVDEEEAKKIADELLGVLKPVLALQTWTPKVPEIAPQAPLPSIPRETSVTAPTTNAVAEQKIVTIKPVGLPPLPVQSITPKEPLTSQPLKPFGEFRVPAPLPESKPSSLETSSPAPAPFILHEHKEIETGTKVQANIPPLIRPSFNYEKPAEIPKPPVVSIQNSQNQGSPLQTARIVNYSAPKIPLESQTAIQNAAISFTPPKPNVNPDNIIDLKDLPK